MLILKHNKHKSIVVYSALNGVNEKRKKNNLNELMLRKEQKGDLFVQLKNIEHTTYPEKLRTNASLATKCATNIYHLDILAIIKCIINRK